MARLPTVGGDEGDWGAILNEYLLVAHNESGTLKNLFTNVKDYGAVGDGVADDTAAVQAAFNATLRLPIYIPTGNYNVSSLTFPDGVTIFGAGMFGPGASTITFSGTGTAFAPATNTYGLHVNIKDIAIVKAGTKAGTGIQLTGCYHSEITRVRVQNFSIGIDFDCLSWGCYFDVIDHCYLNQCITGIRLNGTSSWYCNANTLKENVFRGNTTGILANQYSDGNLYQRNDIEFLAAGTSICMDIAGNRSILEQNWLESVPASGDVFTALRVTGINNTLLNNIYVIQSGVGTSHQLVTALLDQTDVQEPSLGMRSAPAYFRRVKALGGGNLKAYWRMQEQTGTTASDASGNGLTATYRRTGSTLIGVSLANLGIGDRYYSAHFDGTGYLNIYTAGLNSAFNGAEGTISIFAKVDSGIWTDGLVRRIFYIGVDGNNSIEIQRPVDNNAIRFLYKAGGTTKSQYQFSLYTLDWLHLTLTWSKANDRVTAYVNGVAVGAALTGLGTWAGSLNSGNCMIGSVDATPTNPFIGTLAHATVFNRELSATEVDSLSRLV
jgi:hypothetical protein